MRWLGRFFRRARLDRELDRELQFHIDARTDEGVAAGLTPVEARRRALAEFGRIEPIREQTRDVRGTRWLADLADDIRYALRLLRANPGFTVAAVLSLAVGLGANAAVFRVIDGLVLRRLDVPRASELFLLESTDAAASRFSFHTYQQLAAVAPRANLAAFTAPVSGQVTISGATDLQQYQLVSGNWFPMFGVSPAAGRLFSTADDDGAAPQTVVVISDRFWIERYGRSASAIGSTLRLNDELCTVIGVGAAGFDGIHVGQRVDLWLPVAAQHLVHYHSNVTSNDADNEQPWAPQDGIEWLSVMGRAPASEWASVLAATGSRYRTIADDRAAHADTPARRGRLERDHLELSDASRGLSSLRGSLAPALAMLMGMVALVLLVACANLANLLLARGAARTREFALRLSLGARRGRLVRQLLAESLTLAAIGGLAGFALSAWAAPALLQLVATSTAPPPIAMPIDARMVLFAVLATLLTAALFGLIPALRLSRPAVQDTLKAGGRVVNAGARRGRPALTQMLVITQVALSLLLVVGAALFVQTFRNYLRVDLGVDRSSLLDARFDMRLSGIEVERLSGVYSRLLADVRALPGVRSAALGVVGPVTGSNRSTSLELEGYAPARGEEIVVGEEFVGAGYFTTLGQQVLAGRDFGDGDIPGRRRVAVINQTMAARYYGGGSPLGRAFGEDAPTEYEIVGVVADVRSSGLKDAVQPTVYYPMAQNLDEFARNLYVRAGGPIGALPSEISAAIQRAAPSVAVREVVTFEELAERTVSAERLVSRLTSIFSLLGVAVACLGLYGTIAYSVARRTSEIGVRLALGASPGTIRLMIVRETMRLAVVGAVGGVLLALALGRLLSAQVFGLSPRDPFTLCLSTAIVLVVGFLAGAAPAWRASRVNPTMALRAD